MTVGLPLIAEVLITTDDEQQDQRGQLKSAAVASPLAASLSEEARSSRRRCVTKGLSCPLRLDKAE